MKGGVRGMAHRKMIIRSGKKEEKRGESSKQSNENMLSYMIVREEFYQIVRQIDKLNNFVYLADFKLISGNKSISDRQKILIVEVEISKKFIQLKLQQIKQEIQFLKNIKNQPIPQDIHQLSSQINHKLALLDTQIKIKHELILKNQAIYTQSITSAIKIKQNLLKSLQQKRISKLKKQSLLKDTQQKVLTAQKQIASIDKQSKQLYEEKKKENNLLQQIKGNIRVYCRLRPAHHQRIQYQIADSMIKLKRDKTQLKSKNRVQEYEYLFQKIFGQDTPQQVVFDELAELVQCSVDGRNVCIFAYGQTGSGKTHTMTGNLFDGDSQLRGFIPRSIEYIFEQVNIAQSNGYEAHIFVSICEVYNDKIFDLLSHCQPKPNINKTHQSQRQNYIQKSTSIQRSQSSQSKRFASASKPKTKTYTGSSSKKQLHQQKSTDDLVSYQVINSQEAIFALTNALRHRTTAQTKMNTESSRSHLIFQIKNQFINLSTKHTRTSSLVLVDLAGSQRQKDSGVTGIRLQEAKSINNSLTQLGKVMRAIKDQERPTFRNCKLTIILQKYLESDSKAVMFVNVSPDKKDLDQTVNSLVFAESVRQCKLKNKNIKSTSSF